MTPFWRSRPSRQLGAAIVAALAVAVIIAVSPIGSALLSFGALPWQFWPLLVVLTVAYLTLIEIVKRIFDKREARRPEAIARTTAFAAVNTAAKAKVMPR
jgi:Mg2+-importing ATPase